ncbi:MAG: glutamate--cysteine ligase [Microcoleus sp. PH2017_29_MFU_D_A]|uniref:glutamate--cysteine ligase n=1 Tax=unclassified Microcoleus TaxID=2642155 RepID=UPI001E034355|nr:MULTISPECIES: glutamate--cysteine ligase [unclassified Microcoleus]MCC3419224.1 glutamate--cysteine ligase [Microcoleus sp. PH2017_07_MST_O_A]MCC3428762.1 glutamate--cysteine ligase [Microcoleus sp. PH2017_04_SCI_O_A]MCC3443555.1 glutamate--cysteine ligase [Microcoleus sp. PH2017_03_ELD_O_A]MCC3465617.1 glutamate--cysteine ligase [Microcoleus sp. PH2017_06_SFM_O_A]MCC3504402.1 glutamate--cysteine ligase [Microcoleus sp. PH2017_19_SFW_U_A]MCC3509921.1 glutamate--cysteine ligase [Microcoleus
MLLSKGFEVEMYTGTPEGEVVGLSDRIVADLEGFVREPDSRNVEYTTAPLCSYDRLLCALVKPRVRLREYLKQLGDYTLLPGSTLSLGGSDRFYRSDPNNPYHTYIEQTYGTKVVTASIHINIGISEPEMLMRAIRLARVEAPLYLALSASSPFLDGEVTGYHSTRWGLFPKTPAIVPLFESHKHYIQWTEEQLELGSMQNVRHLWSAVRPNGDRRPYCLNRLELRICDLEVNPLALLAITALLEARIWQMMEDPGLDPLALSTLPAATRNQDLVALTDANEIAASRQSLDAELTHWQDGRKILARDWIEEIYQEVWPIAKKRGFSCFLSPLKKILREGNTAQQWLKLYEGGLDARTIILQGIDGMAHQEWELEDNLCGQLVA